MSLGSATPSEIRVAALLLGAATLYLVRHFPLGAPAWRQRLSEQSALGWAPDARALLMSRWSSGAVLGLGGLLLCSCTGGDAQDVGLGSASISFSLAWAIGVWVLLLPLLLSSARRPAILSRYPEIRGPLVSRSLIRHSALSWIGFLWGYELLFRGVLLLALVAELGPVSALAISTSMYALAHLEKPAAEAFSCLLMGLVFGAMTLSTGAIWSAWLCHVLICLTTESATGRSHPDIRWGEGS